MLERFLFPANVKPLQTIMPRLRAAANPAQRPLNA